MNYKQSAFLIDSCAYFFRYYFSDVHQYFSDEGHASGGVYGFTSFLLSILEKYSPGFGACCFDEALDTCFRNDIYPQYKANRAAPDEDIEFQLGACKQIAELLGFSVFAHNRYEADDLIGSLVRQVCEDLSSKNSCESLFIISGDKDFYQLLDDSRVVLWDITKKAPISQSDCNELTQLLPEQWIDFQTLVGDAVDNVPGVKGIGVKTATQLLHQYGSLTGILENIEQLNTLKIRNIKNIQSQIQDNISSIAVSKILVTIEKNLTLIDKNDDIVVKPISFDGAEKFCCQMGFPNLVNRIERLIQLN